jgi:hypothetical protein
VKGSWRAGGLALVLLGRWPAPSEAGAQTPLTINDQMRLASVLDVALAPDASSAVYVLSIPRPTGNRNPSGGFTFHRVRRSS